MFSLPTTEAEAKLLDQNDPLREVRDRFVLPEGIAYFDGHSLGPLPRDTRRIQEEVVTRQWGGQLIGGWNDAGWIDAPQRIGAKIARLIGAKPHEVIVADSTSINLFKLLVATSQLSDRPTILTEAGDFHTDRYIADGVARMTGLRLKSVPRAALAQEIGPDTNIVSLNHVHYGTAERHDIVGLTAIARDAGVPILWDLCHSAGAMPLQLNRDGAELAVGCGYKYLNGGPGAPAFLYVAEHLQDRLSSPLQGWMGHAAPFDFTDAYAPASGIDRFLAGTPPILSLTALEGGIDAFDGLSMEALWAKSVALFEMFKGLMADRCPDLICATPAEPHLRGSHIAFRHPHAFEICQALISAGIMGDFRAPNIIRFGLTPLYLRFVDVWSAAEHCAAVIDTACWKRPEYSVRRKVT